MHACSVESVAKIRDIIDENDSRNRIVTFANSTRSPYMFSKFNCCKREKERERRVYILFLEFIMKFDWTFGVISSGNFLYRKS